MIDHCMISPILLDKCRGADVIDNIDNCSDHLPISVSFDIKLVCRVYDKRSQVYAKWDDASIIEYYKVT